jgi:hypothetical protein
VGINHIDYDMCNDLYDDGIVHSVMLYRQVCLAVVKIVASPFSVGKAQGRKDWIDATVSKLGKLTGILETIDAPGYCWYCGH